MKFERERHSWVAAVVCVALACVAPACADDPGSETTAQGTGDLGDGDPGDGDPGDGDPGDGDPGDGDPGDCVPLENVIDPQLEDLVLTTSDGKQIAATLAHPGAATCRPALLLIHQYTLDRQQWAAQIPIFVQAGYVVLAIDLRGHGESDAQDGPLSGILTDPAQAPLDVAAGVELLASDPAVDPARLAVVGTSVGANLAIVAMHQHAAISRAVSLSPRTDPVQSLAKDPGTLDLDELYCLAGELDAGGQALACEAFVEAASGPASQAWIFAGTAAHGVELVEDFPETLPAIIDWLSTTL